MSEPLIRELIGELDKIAELRTRLQATLPQESEPSAASPLPAVVRVAGDAVPQSSTPAASAVTERCAAFVCATGLSGIACFCERYNYDCANCKRPYSVCEASRQQGQEVHGFASDRCDAKLGERLRCCLFGDHDGSHCTRFRCAEFAGPVEIDHCEADDHECRCRHLFSEHIHDAMQGGSECSDANAATRPSSNGPRTTRPAQDCSSVAGGAATPDAPASSTSPRTSLKAEPTPTPPAEQGMELPPVPWWRPDDSHDANGIQHRDYGILRRAAEALQRENARLQLEEAKFRELWDIASDDRSVQLTRARQAESEAASLREEVERLKDVLRENREHYNTQEDRIDKADRDLFEGLQQAADKIKAEAERADREAGFAADLREDLNDARSGWEGATAEVGRLQSELSEARTKLAEAETERDEARRKARRRKRQEERANKDRDAWKSRAESAEARLIAMGKALYASPVEPKGGE